MRFPKSDVPVWMQAGLVILNLLVIAFPWLRGVEISLSELLLSLFKQFILIPGGFWLAGYGIQRRLDPDFNPTNSYFLGLLMAAVITVQYARGFV